ncbi:MAG: PDZ domain-containing protein [Planctomycetes bacterium]|nr:PDZ domain-containing protein [Planctomycetota bacterium]
MLLCALLSVASFQFPQAPAAAPRFLAPQERAETQAAGRQWAHRPGRLGVTLGSAAHGVGIASVEPDSPAGEAGLRAGDRIVVVDGRQVTASNAVVEAVRARGAGNELALIVERDLSIDVLNLATDGGEARPRLGVLLDSSSNELRVASVEDGGPAERAEVRAGDRVLSLEGEPTQDAETLRARVAELGAGRTVKLTIARELHAKLADAPGQSLFATPAPMAPRAPTPPKAPRRRSHSADAVPVPPAPMAPPQPAAVPVGPNDLTSAIRDLRAELGELRRELGELRQELADRRQGR